MFSHGYVFRLPRISVILPIYFRAVSLGRWYLNIEGLVQERRNSGELAMELRLSALWIEAQDFFKAAIEIVRQR